MPRKPRITAALALAACLALAPTGAAFAAASTPPAFATSASPAGRAVDFALSQRGTFYRLGGESPGGFDCSGLVQWSYRQAGVQLPRTAHAQSKVGRAVTLDQIQPGDLIFFGSARKITHVAMFVDHDTIVEASRPGKPIATRSLYKKNLQVIRRVQ